MRSSCRLLLALLLLHPAAASLAADDPTFEPVVIPDWVRDVTRMAFLNPSQADEAADMGVQVVHTNVVWPYYPLHRDGGGLSKADADALRSLVASCHRRGMKLVLGLPPFPPVSLVKDHPDWRVHPDDTGAILKVEPKDDNLGNRIGCNLGPWGDYLIELLGELVRDYGVDGYSFDGNYHPPICYCPACKAAYRSEADSDLPKKVDLDDLAYRRYLVWRGRKLEDHYRRIQAKIKGINPDAVLMSWTVNAGRYGHFLTSPRAMPTRMNLLFDLPMQEWWLDETNLGASVAPSFGAAYLRGIVGGRPNASEPYLMSRGNPYGTDSFPRHERIVRALLATTHGGLAPESLGWPGHRESTKDVFREIQQRESWITRAQSLPWAALLVSEQTRQFYAYKDIAERFLPHVFGAFRAALEEHRPLDLINDWDLSADRLKGYRVLVLANAAALSDAQAEAVREYVRRGGGLVATGETSLFDDLGRPRPDFALADVFGVSYRGRPAALSARPDLDANFAVALDETYWKERVGVARLSWTEHPLFDDPRLSELVPTRSVVFRGPQALVGEPSSPGEVAARLTPESGDKSPHPAIIAHRFGEGRVVYLAAGLDAALWSYAYPYQRRLLIRALDWAAGAPPSIAVEAPMCVEATFFEQSTPDGRRLVLHLFNGLDSAAHHGLPRNEVPLREESIPIQCIRVRFSGEAPRTFHVEPGHRAPKVRREGDSAVVEMPPLEVHDLLVGEGLTRE